MPHPLTCLLLALAPQTVQGLRPGEEALASPAPALAAEDPLAAEHAGRVLDARSGLPIDGARVELWTEEIDEAGRGLRQVSEARTGPDGLFRLRVRDGALVGDKLRVRHPGHLAFAGTLADLPRIRLQPAPAEPLALRVLDLQDRPIDGARVTSTYSCSHDVPGATVLTDALGLALLPEHGLQDHEGDLRLRAPGHGALEYVDLDELLAHPAHPGPATLHLARRRPLRARFLDRQGRPLAHESLHVVDDDAFHVGVTDAEGLLELDSRYGTGAVYVQRLGALPDERFVFAGPLPVAPVVALRRDPTRIPADRLDALLRLSGAPTGTAVTLFHDEGWVVETVLGEERETLELAVPSGACGLLLGGPFEAVAETWVPVELEPGQELELELLPALQPRLTLRCVPGELDRLTVQAGNESCVVDVPDDGRVELPVPAGADLVVLGEGSVRRRAARAGLERDASLDLTTAGSLLPPGPLAARAALPPGTRRVAIDAEGEAELTLVGPGEVERLGPRAFLLRAPAGLPLLLRASADGHAPCDQVAATTADGTDLRLALTPLARLELDAPAGTTVLGPLADHLDALHPGPLTLTLARPDGSRLRLSLRLSPGEHRRLVLDGR